MAEVMLDEIGRRPGSAAKGAEEQQQQQQGSNSGTGLHKVRAAPLLACPQCRHVLQPRPPLAHLLAALHLPGLTREAVPSGRQSKLDGCVAMCGAVAVAVC
jgi:hypothetical protein